MTTAIVKWGNSQGIRIPKVLLQNINLSENDTVEVLVEKDAIIIKKSPKENHRTTRERLAAFHGKNIRTQTETDWGRPVGKEVW
jgi:antitoxin MazE